jgi:hypothetical protein
MAEPNTITLYREQCEHTETLIQHAKALTAVVLEIVGCRSNGREETAAQLAELRRLVAAMRDAETEVDERIRRITDLERASRADAPT